MDFNDKSIRSLKELLTWLDSNLIDIFSKPASSAIVTRIINNSTNEIIPKVTIPS